MHKQNKQYQQLTEGQRYQIQALHGNGFSQRKRAATIGVCSSTVPRELRRNMPSDGEYCAETANQLKNRRKIVARKHNKSHERHGKIITDGLLMSGSPEKISLRMKIETPALAVSHSTLYRWIAADKASGGRLHTQLPHGFGKRRWKGGKRNHAGRAVIPGRIDISQRPQVVEERSR